MPEESYLDEQRKKLDSMLTSELVNTFDQLAKLYMRASAEFSDTSNVMPVLPRIQKAHAFVTLIVDDAMHGLADATTHAVGYGLMTGIEAGSKVDDEGSPSAH